MHAYAQYKQGQTHRVSKKSPRKISILNTASGFVDEAALPEGVNISGMMGY